jgi:hypothetical protein
VDAETAAKGEHMTRWPESTGVHTWVDRSFRAAPEAGTFGAEYDALMEQLERCREMIDRLVRQLSDNRRVVHREDDMFSYGLQGAD